MYIILLLYYTMLIILVWSLCRNCLLSLEYIRIKEACIDVTMHASSADASTESDFRS